MNIVINLFKKKSKLIIFEIFIIIFYIILLFGLFLDFIVFNDFGIFSQIIFWMLFTGNPLLIFLYHIALLLIPIISIIIYRKNYLSINLTCLSILLIHTILYFYLLFSSLAAF